MSSPVLFDISSNQENAVFSSPSKPKTTMQSGTPLRDVSNIDGILAQESHVFDSCDQLSVSILIEEDDNALPERDFASNFDYSRIVAEDEDELAEQDAEASDTLPGNLLQEIASLREQHANEKKVLLEELELKKHESQQAQSNETAMWKARAEMAERLLRDQASKVDSLIAKNQEMEQKQEELEQSETVFAEKLADLELAKATLDQQLAESESNLKKLSIRYEQLKQLYQDSLKAEQSRAVALANAKQDVATAEAKCSSLSQQVQEMLVKSTEEVARIEAARARDVALLQALLTAKEVKTETTIATLQAEFSLLLSENRELHRIMDGMMACVDPQ